MSADLHLHAFKSNDNRTQTLIVDYLRGDDKGWNFVMTAPEVWLGQFDSNETPEPLRMIEAEMGGRMRQVDPFLTFNLVYHLSGPNRSRFKMANSWDVGRWLDAHLGWYVFLVRW